MATEIPKSVHAGPDDSWHGVVDNSTNNPFQPEKGRYHMYIGLFCPFAHRANLVRHLKGLQDVIDISVVKPYPKGNDKGWPGWQFPESDGEYPNATVDKLFASKYLHEVYFKADKEYNGRYSVPLLWDKKTDTAVNNESAELLRWLQTAFDDLISPEKAKLTLYPEHLRQKIDKIAEWMQSDLNTGVYKAGFATDQDTYNKNLPPVFGALNKLEKLLYESKGPYVLGKHMTELDIRLYATLIRFDTVYVQHFKCNLGTIRHDYPVLNNWLKGMYWNHEEFRNTTDFKHIKENYTKSHFDINPKAITPLGPWPYIEKGYEEDWSRLTPGEIDMPEVLEHEKTLEV
ncbi:glutathione S-transferase [Aureobasidium sp. EXF-8845]|nr:glutathione S-transferase [Aureobasidium sp. EXF-8845]KAI4847304.1 glutathione S-transferase [Aureobasidium sp. EXF-8846]